MDEDEGRPAEVELLFDTGRPEVREGPGPLDAQQGQPELPPAELAVHPSDANNTHELYLMCDDVKAFIAEMAAKGVECTAVDEQRWGAITRLTLPGGGTIGVYQPKHPSPLTQT